MALSITQQQLAIAQTYAASGDYQGGWQYLASIGDNYADNAYVVTTGNGQGYFDNLMHRLVKNYWDTVAGPDAYTEKFDSVARQHFRQYVRDIANNPGNKLPDSKQIEKSYRDAVTDHGLPPNTAIDGAITQSFGEAFDRMWPGEKHEGLDWTDGLGMEDERQVPSDVYNDLDWWESFKDLIGSGWDAFWDQLKKDLQDAWKDVTDGLDDLGKDIKDWWDRAKNWVWPRDPILLDLDGDGLETVGLASNVYFDHDGDGVLTKTGWAGANDALLVWDRNGNGTIDTGAELFGDFTVLPNGTLAPNGFAALAALDANGDGVIDATDPAFAELKLWRDISQDGVSQGGELVSLADAGIVSLNLAHSLKNQRLANGNTLAREGTFTRADGSTSAMGEFRLATDTFNTRFAEPVEVPEPLKTLPTMGGAGNVRELQQAAAQSSSLAGVLAQFQNAGTRAEQKALLDQLITAWADTSGMAGSLEARAAGKYRIVYEAFGNERRSSSIDTVAFAASSGSVGSAASAGALLTDAGGMYLSEHYRNLISDWSRKLHVLEAFNGQYFFNLPGETSQTDGANWGLAISAGSGGGGSGAMAIAAYPTLRVNFSQGQLDLLQQAYDSLKESVYASLVMQTRLKPYLDQIELVIDNDGIRLDAAALNQKLAEKKATDPENYLADLLDLDRYAGAFLAGTNWQGLADFDTLIDSLPNTPAIQALLDEFKVRRLTDTDESQWLGDDADIVLAGEGISWQRQHSGCGNDAIWRVAA